MVNMRNKKFSRFLSLIVVLSILSSTFVGITVSAEAQSVNNKAFYENFEDFTGTADVGKSFPSYNGWSTANITRQSGNVNYAEVSTVDTGSAKGKAFNIKFTKTTTDKIDIFGLSKNPEIVIGNDDIIISGDVYIPAANSDNNDKQYVRFIVSRGSGNQTVTNDGDWQSYVPNSTAAFGLHFTKNNGGNTWSLAKLLPKKSTGGIVGELAVTNFAVTGDTWYRLDYVYHPLTNTVDYYIDGNYVTSSPTGTYTVGNQTYTFEIPNHIIGGNLGNIVLAAGGKLGVESAAKFDNVSVRTISSAGNVSYGEISSGSSYINARFDIPVKKDTISDANITVKKLADDDVTFSGNNATVVDASNYTIDYKDEGGVGIKLTSAVTDDERYQIIVAGLTDIFGNSAKNIYNCSVSSTYAVKAITFENKNGKMLGEDITGAKRIKLHLGNQLPAPTTVKLTADRNNVAFEGSFDEASGIYTITLNKVLIGNTQYKLSVDDILINQVFATGDAGFNETFESFGKGTVTATADSQPINSEWKSVLYNGNTVDVVTEENTSLNGKAIKMIPKNHSVLPMSGIYRETNIKVDERPVVVSSDIYLPELTESTRQLVRVLVSRGTSESNVTVSDDIKTPYQPFRIASFGLSFDNKSGNAWNVYMMEPDVNNAFKEVAVKTNGKQLQITGDKKITVECVYYPTEKMVYYYINGEQISTSTWGYEVKMDVPDEMGNVVLISGSGEVNNHALFDNIKVFKKESNSTGGEGIGGALEAYAKAGNPAELINIASVRATGGGMENTTVDNENVWHIEGAVDKYVLFDIQESFGNSAVDGSSFLVEIEYYDETFEISDGNTTHGIGFFSVWIDDLNYGPQMVKHVPLIGDNQWKKVTIELDNAAFSNGVNGIADIMLSLYDHGYYQSSTSYAPLNLKSIKVTKLKGKNPVLLESYADAIGNTFEWYEEEKQIKNIFTNTQDRDVSLNAEYYLIDKYGNTKFSATEDFVISANSTVERNINIDCNECGLYEWVVKITDDAGIISSRFKEDTICIVKTAEDGLKNTSAWLNEPLVDYSPEMQEVALQLMNLANIRGVRLPNRWRDIENESGLDVTKSAIWKVADLCDDYGIEYWVKMSGCSVLYQDTNPKSSKIPTTDKELAAWKKFCRHIIENYAARGVELFEIWNEPNVEAYNPTNESAEALVKVTQLAKDAAIELYNEGKIANPVKIAGLSITNINRDDTYETWLKRAVDAGLTGGENGIDVLNLHTYEVDGIPEMVKTYDSVQKYRDYIYEQTGVKDIPVLISEYGNSTANTYTTEESKRDWLIRSLILYRMKGIGQQVGVHNLAKVGYLENSIEDNYGLVSSVNERANIEGKNGIPTETYLAYAGMNYILRGEITPVEELDSGENIKISRLSRDTLGDDVLAMWTVYDDAEIVVDVGDTEITYYDCFGNEQIMCSADGRYKIKLDSKVSYITGEFDDVELISSKQVIYESFSDHKSYVPYDWTRSSIGGTIDTGTDIAPLEIDEQYGTSLKIGSRPRDNQYGNHAISREIGYVAENGTPVKFHTDLRIQETEEVTWYNPVWKDNSYHVCITSSSDIEDTILGFKLVGEAGFLKTPLISVYYWDEDSNDFVKSDKTVFGDSWISLDAIYDPDTGNVVYYVDGTRIGSGKAGIGENKVLESVLLAAQTLHSTDVTTMCPGIYDNICLMPYDETTKPVFFTEMGHSANNATIKFNTTALNQFASTDTVTILTAFYDEKGRLLDIIKEPKTLAGEKFQNISTGEVDMPTDGMRVKFFIWDKDSITPLSPTYEVKYN